MMKRHRRVPMALATLTAALAGLSPSVPAQPRSGGRDAPTVLNHTLSPRWLPDSTRFWYRRELPGGRYEFVLVDAVAGTRNPAFDHQRLADALRQAGIENAAADRLPIDAIAFEASSPAITFRSRNLDWRFDLDTFQLTRSETRSAAPAGGLAPLPGENAPRASARTGRETSLTFVNQTGDTLELFWLSTGGERRSYGRIDPGGTRDQHTYAGHVWEVVDASGTVLAMYEAPESPARAEITGRAARYRRGPGRGRPRERPPAPTRPWTASVREHDVFLRSTQDDTEVQLTTDGTADRSYGMLEGSPDGGTLVAWRITPGENKEVYLIESSPRGGGRAVLHTRPYALPGDRFASHTLTLFDIASGTQMTPDVDPVALERPRLRWSADGLRFTYEHTDRGHQRFRLIEITCATGAARTLIDETSDMFIWTAHTENVAVPRLTYLEATDELIYASERDGWRHLYLVDVQAGAITHRITQGELVVRGIDRIDEERRQIWFHASGRNAGQDPYLIHYYRVHFDGSELTALTEGDGTHALQYSPDGQTIVDTYSRVDMPPVHELRRVSDGARVCVLERAELEAPDGWEPPEVFTAKGRDGVTDIWGIICRPSGLDPGRKYPILEDIYAGPQSSYVPKSFSASPRYRSLTELGFIVVKIDGMGTANRSKAFHDVCWQNLKDAGLPDRILWIQAAARAYPYMDTTRVGIYGTSAGGQNAAAAVLFHPEFYKAAAASCGCHDNRMDKASWNEQWMGFPVGPHYAANSNIENAHRLRGHLLLIVGEMDTNVPPESTMRFADALIKAGKDFDLVVVPGAGHGGGGSYGARRMQDFFVRHLMDKEPPHRNEG